MNRKTLALTMSVVIATSIGAGWPEGVTSRRPVSALASAPIIIPADSGAPSPDSVYRLMAKVAKWQLAAFYPVAEPSYPLGDWTNCPLYAGLLALGELGADSTYYARVRSVGEALHWQLAPGDDRYFADNYCIGQIYARLYTLHRDPAMIADLQHLADTLLARPLTESLAWENDVHLREWAWCDALFMGPMPLATLGTATGQRKYLDLADRLWWKTTAFLYDTTEHLYFRDSRFFDAREPNGRKVFWSRGNGWVMAGLVRMLDVMPADYPDRPKWIRLYRDMAATVAGLLQPDGTWHPSLLDPAAYPVKETSGTGFYTYALAWGINHRLLSEREYAPVVLRAWAGLTAAVQPDGKLGFVQHIGASPDDVGPDDTEVFGVGAFLLAGTEVLKMLAGSDREVLRIAVTNPTPLTRTEEVVEVPWSALTAKKPDLREHAFVVVNATTSAEVPFQVVYRGDKKPQSVLFQVSVAPAATALLALRPGTPKNYPAKTFGRFVPERLDDFAWENDRIAFRMYGPALAKTGDVSAGIDVWAKRTDRLVIDRWYQKGEYHQDAGEGLDAYEVGSTLGAGATAPYVKGQLWGAGNYQGYRVLDNGPLRTTFVLTYAPFDVAGTTVREVRTISLDAGSQLNRIEDEYLMAQDSMPVAIGIAAHDGQGAIQHDTVANVMSYWEAADGDGNGMLGVGVVVPGGRQVQMHQANEHLLASVTYTKGQPLIYYQGAGWQKSGRFPDVNAWQEYLRTMAQRLAAPLTVELGPMP